MSIFAQDLKFRYKGLFRLISQEVKVRLFKNKLEKKNLISDFTNSRVEVEI